MSAYTPKKQENYNLKTGCSCVCDGGCEGNRFNCTCSKAKRINCNKACGCYEKALGRYEKRYDSTLGRYLK